MINVYSTVQYRYRNKWKRNNHNARFVENTHRQLLATDIRLQEIKAIDVQYEKDHSKNEWDDPQAWIFGGRLNIKY